MNSLAVRLRRNEWSFLQGCHLWKAMGRLFQVPSVFVPSLSSIGDCNLGSPGTAPSWVGSWVGDYVLNSRYEDKRLAHNPWDASDGLNLTANI